MTVEYRTRLTGFLGDMKNTGPAPVFFKIKKESGKSAMSVKKRQNILLAAIGAIVILPPFLIMTKRNCEGNSVLSFLLACGGYLLVVISLKRAWRMRK